MHYNDLLHKLQQFISHKTITLCVDGGSQNHRSVVNSTIGVEGTTF